MRKRKIDRDELTAVLEDHRKWLESSGELGTKADLRGRDLSRHNLQQANLERANLEGVNLYRTNLRTANFKAANLKAGSMVEADLQWAIFLCADLRDARLERASLHLLLLDNIAMAVRYSIHYFNRRPTQTSADSLCLSDPLELPRDRFALAQTTITSIHQFLDFPPGPISSDG